MKVIKFPHLSKRFWHFLRLLTRIHRSVSEQLFQRWSSFRQYYENGIKKKITPKTNKRRKIAEEINKNSNESSSDSEIDVRCNDEDLDLSETDDLKLEVGKFVIIKYEGNYYPGEYILIDGKAAFQWPI